MLEIIHDPVITGVLFAILAACCFAFWNIFLQRGLVAGGSNRQSVVILNICTTVFHVPVVAGLALTGALPAISRQSALWFLLVGVTAGALGPSLSAGATRGIGAANTTALRLLDPFFAFAIALLFLRERVSLQAVSGMVLIVIALGALQRFSGGNAGASISAGGDRVSGLGFAIAASLAFTLASVARKAGMNLTPSAWVSGLAEGSLGLLIWSGSALLKGGFSDLRTAFRRQNLDLWLAGLASAAGALCTNLSLQRVPVPVTVTLRNTAPWFVLFLAPVLLGRQYRAGAWMWLSTALLTGGMLLIVLR